MLDPRSDDFYRKHAGLNFGEVGMSVKALMVCLLCLKTAQHSHTPDCSMPACVQEHYQSTESKHKQVRCILG